MMDKPLSELDGKVQASLLGKVAALLAKIEISVFYVTGLIEA